MRKKTFLTSAMAALFAVPAFAEIVQNATCNITNLGQSDDNSTANVEAIWNANLYSEAPGQYLKFENGTIEQNQVCPAGFFCEGFTNQLFNDSSMGLSLCPVGYANSAAGSDEQNDCYTPGTVTCATLNPYPNYATAVTYGNSTNGTASCKTYYGNQSTCVLDNENACDITDLTCAKGYHSEGGNPITLEAETAIAYSIQNSQTTSGFKSNSGTGTNSNDTGLENGEWVANWSGHITVQGRASCNSTTPSNMAEIESAQGDEYRVQLAASAQPSNTFNTTSTGPNCWCNLKSYQIPNAQSSVDISSSWVFISHSDDANECANSCAFNCTFGMLSTPNKQALWQTIEVSELQCVANTINIDWNPNNGDSHTQNQCTYGGAITLPDPDPEKTGYIFKRWRLKRCSSYTTQNTCPTDRCVWDASSGVNGACGDIPEQTQAPGSGDDSEQTQTTETCSFILDINAAVELACNDITDPTQCNNSERCQYNTDNSICKESQIKSYCLDAQSQNDCEDETTSCARGHFCSYDTTNNKCVVLKKR